MGLDFNFSARIMQNVLSEHKKTDIILAPTFFNKSTTRLEPTDREQKNLSYFITSDSLQMKCVVTRFTSYCPILRPSLQPIALREFRRREVIHYQQFLLPVFTNHNTLH